jgi:hypothetical protein
MSDLPKPVEDHFKGRGTAKLDKLPHTRKAFKDLTGAELQAIGMLDKLYSAIEQDLDDGNWVGDGAAVPDALTPAEKLQTFVYSIH